MDNTIHQWNPKLYNNKHSFVYHYGEDLVKLLNPKANERILDLGCGLGQLTFKISKLAKEVVGMDKSPEMISGAKSKFPGINFQIGDAADFIFAEKFNSIFSNATLHWVKNYKGAIKCMFENLMPNGKIVLEFGGKGNVQIIVDQLKYSLLKRNYLANSKLDPWYFPSIGEYATELEKVGFRVIMAQHFNRPTALADENTGIIDWISMFGKMFFVNVAQKQAEEIKNEVQEMLKTRCLVKVNGKNKWIADYKRIRIVAIKDEAVCNIT